MFSQLYLEWVKETGQSNLTNSQHKFAEFLLSNENEMKRIGNMEDVFISVRKFVKTRYSKVDNH